MLFFFFYSTWKRDRFHFSFPFIVWKSASKYAVASLLCCCNFYCWLCFWFPFLSFFVAIFNFCIAFVVGFCWWLFSFCLLLKLFIFVIVAAAAVCHYCTCFVFMVRISRTGCAYMCVEFKSAWNSDSLLLLLLVNNITMYRLLLALSFHILLPFPIFEALLLVLPPSNKKTLARMEWERERAKNTLEKMHIYLYYIENVLWKKTHSINYTV